MAHFTYVKGPSGDWTGITVITDPELTQFDQNLFKAINGDDGGTWAPAAVITIGGDGLTVSGPFIADDVQNLTVFGTFGLDSGAVATLSNGATVNVESGHVWTWENGSDAVWESGATETFEAGSTLAMAGTVSVSSGGIITLASGAEFTVNSGVLSAISIGSGSVLNCLSGSATTIAGTVALSGVVTRSGAGRIKPRVSVVTDVNATRGVTDCDVVRFVKNVDTGWTLTLAIASDTPSDGEEITVIREGSSTTTSLVVKNEGSAANIISFGAAQNGAALFRYSAGTSKWRLMSHYPSGATPGADASP